jgi:L-ascorbate metabolism protein UlaG (beta-lactamase superfamily)
LPTTLLLTSIPVCTPAYGRAKGGDTPDTVCLGDLGVTYQEPQERMKELMSRLGSLGDEVLGHLRASEQGSRDDGGTLVYLFETPEGSLLHQDTSGHWSGILRNLQPDVAMLAAAGRGNIDGEPIQGSLAQFVARQADLIRPRRMVLSHHDTWLSGFTRAVDVAPSRTELARWAPKTKLTEMGDLAVYPIFEELSLAEK